MERVTNINIVITTMTFSVLTMRKAAKAAASFTQEGFF
jgi:predicted tellurium resistance membrane protein TerC